MPDNRNVASQAPEPTTDSLVAPDPTDQVRHHVFGAGFRRYLRILAQPRKRDTHVLDLHPKVLAETYIAFDHVAHIAHLVAEHEGAFNAHAEGKT